MMKTAADWVEKSTEGTLAVKRSAAAGTVAVEGPAAVGPWRWKDRRRRGPWCQYCGRWSSAGITRVHGPGKKRRDANDQGNIGNHNVPHQLLF
jgi:hypothetical protein